MQLDSETGLFLPSDYVDRRGTLEDPSVPLTDFDRISEMTGGGPSESGVRVNAYKALTYGPVFRAVTLIAGDVAKVPLITYRRTSGDGKIRAFDHPAYRLLRYEPNELMTAATFWSTMTAHKLLWGNSYALIETDGAGNPTALLPLLPDRTEPEIDEATGQLWYKTRIGSTTKYFYPEEIFHVPGLAFDGLKGYSVISLARNSIALGLAAELFASKFYKNGAKASGVLMHPRGLSKKGQENLQHSFEEKHTGSVDKAQRVILLEEGAKFLPLSIPPNEAQFLETRQQQVREVALWFGVPPHKLGDKERAAYNTLEEENGSYISDTLDPTYVAIEQEARRKLLTRLERDRDTHTMEFMRQALLRANMTARYQAYAVGITHGFLNRDEVRAAENYNAIPGGKGKEYLVPFNMGPAPTEGDAQQESKAALLADTLRRMAHIEVQQLVRLAKNSDTWRDERVIPALAMHRDRLAGALAPVLAVIAPHRSASELADRWIDETKHRLMELGERETLLKELGARMSECIETRALRTVEETLRQDDSDNEPEPVS